LLAMTDTDGSPEYATTWRRRAMQSGPPICRLLARARRTSDSGCSGWPTCRTKDGEGTNQLRKRRGKNPPCHLSAAAKLAGWGTPSARDGKDAGPAFEADPTIVPTDSRLARQAAVLAGSPATEGYHEAGNTDSSRKTVALAAGWMTPQAMDSAAFTYTHDQGNPDKPRPTLYGQALISGPTASGSPAPTARRGVLNPAFSLWLMGFPSAWLTAAPEARRAPRRCGASATPSSPKSPHCLSGRSLKRKKN
jgi:hypothetical protein